MTGRTLSFLSPTGKHFEKETGEPGGCSESHGYIVYGRVWGSKGIFQNARDQWTEARGGCPRLQRKKKWGELFLWMTPLLETCQLHFENTGQRYCATVSANLDRK